MTVQEALKIIEVEDLSIVNRMQQAPNYDIACQVIEDLHALVRRQKRKLSKKYHPDLGGSLEKMQEINNVIDMLLKINVQPIMPEPIMFRTVIIRSGYATTYSGTTTSSWWA